MIEAEAIAQAEAEAKQTWNEAVALAQQATRFVNAGQIPPIEVIGGLAERVLAVNEWQVAVNEAIAEGD